MARTELPGIEIPQMQSLADQLASLLKDHPESRLIFVEAIIAELRKRNLDQARWFAFESGDKWSSGFENIQELRVHELFFDTVDNWMNPTVEDW